MGLCSPEVYIDELCFLEYEPVKITCELMKKFPHRLIGLITFENEDQNGPLCIGTGILLSRNLVLTVAHNIFSHVSNKYYKNHRFYQNLCGEASEYYTVQNFSIPKAFKEKNEPEFDYALLKLSTKVNSFYFIQLNPNFKEPSANQTVGIYGYNKNNKANWKQLDPKNKYKFMAFQCGLEQPTIDRIKVPQNFHERLSYLISTFPGTSGAPIILFEENDKISIIGIHKGKDINMWRNVGRRITSSLIKRLQDETKKLGAQPFQFIEDASLSKYDDEQIFSIGFESNSTCCEV